MTLSAVKTIIWDLDNTLYPYTEQQIEHWHAATLQAARDLGVSISNEAGMQMARESYNKHNYSSKTFVDTYNLCPQEMHRNMFPHTDETLLPVCELTQNAFQDVQHCDHVILTHASRNWAERVLKHLGLRDFFKDDLIFGLEDYGYEEKHHSNKGIIGALDATGTDPEHALFAEDSLQNLKKAKNALVQTAYLHQGSAGDNDNTPPFVNHVFVNALDLITQLKAAQTTV